MTGRARRRGVFEGLPRAVYRRVGPRYFDAAIVGTVINGLVVAGFGVVTLALYVDLGLADAAIYAACSAAGYALEGLAFALILRRAARPVRRWLAGEREPGAAVQAWSTAAGLPVAMLRRPAPYAIGLAGAAAADVVLAARLGLPVWRAVLALPASWLLYASCVVLRHLALELSARPLLEDIGRTLPEGAPPEATRASLHWRLVVTIPMVTWGGSVIVAGLLTHNSRDLNTIAVASVVAFGVSADISIWLSLVLADTVTGPVVDLRDAMRRVSAGDLATRVPVVSTDETGELAASFNAMVTGLGERERLHDAFGAFVDPGLTERVLAEGTDLEGELVDATLLFVDVRGFTAIAEQAAAHEVVARLNALYDVVVPVILRHGGHANKFIGDGLLAVFGAPDRHADHAARAVLAAHEIAALVRDGRGGDLRVGIGVNSGSVVVGTIGGGGRRDFTVIGDAVNTAARVEAATRLTGDDLLITETTLRQLAADAAEGFEERPSVPLRGKSATVRLYAPR